MAKIRPLNIELAAVARTECLEDVEKVSEHIEDLRKWIGSQDYLTTRTDDQFLVAFLRFAKYDLDNAKKRIEFYYNYKTTAGDLLKSRQIDEKLYSICKTGIFVTLPKPVGPGGPRIHFTRMGNIDTSIYTVQDLFRFHMFRSEIEINTDDNWVIGGVLEIIDFTRIPFLLLRQFDSALFRKMAAFLEYGVPTNLRGTHIVNASREVQLILTLVRSLMKQKELLHIHSNVESLQKAIGKEYLPVEFGGNNGSFDECIETYGEQLRTFEEYFNEDDQYGVDESLRTPAKDNNTNTPKTKGSAKKIPNLLDVNETENGSTEDSDSIEDHIECQTTGITSV